MMSQAQPMIPQAMPLMTAVAPPQMQPPPIRVAPVQQVQQQQPQPPFSRPAMVILANCAFQAIFL